MTMAFPGLLTSLAAMMAPCRCQRSWVTFALIYHKSSIAMIVTSSALNSAHCFGTGDDNAEPGLAQAYQLGLGGTDHLPASSCNISLASVLDWVMPLPQDANDLEGTELERGDDLMLHAGYMVAVGYTVLMNGQVQVIALQRLDESSVIVDNSASTWLIATAPSSICASI